MKRFLSWLAILGCCALIVLFADLVSWFLGYALSLYDRLSAFLKIIVIIFGSSFFLGVFFAPLVYGLPLTVALCEKIYPSKKGGRYITAGILLLLVCIAEIILIRFAVAHIIVIIYAIVLMVMGRKAARESLAIA